MDIPNWVDKGKRSKGERATARLKYIISTLAARHSPRCSMRGLADMVGLNHSTIAIYVRRGAFSSLAAERIVEKLNDPTLTTAMLIDPMSIPKSPG